MEKKNKEKNMQTGRAKFLSLGTSLGMLFGISIGNGIGNLALGMSFGMLLGTLFALCRKSDKGNQEK